MQMLMNILQTLGVNETLWIQLGCFIICFISLSQLIFKPYMAALHEREKRTVGGEETAVRIVEEAHVLQTEYEKKARLVNAEMKSYFDRERASALEQYEKIVSSARESAAAIIAGNRSKISQEIQIAKKSLMNEIPAVSSAIASRLLGKES